MSRRQCVLNYTLSIFLFCYIVRSYDFAVAAKSINIKMQLTFSCSAFVKCVSENTSHL